MQRELVLVLLFLVVGNRAFTSIDLSTCGTRKTCLMGASSGCTASTCDYAASWTMNGAYLEVELLGSVQASGGYLAIGISLDNQMGYDSVVGCTLQNSVITFLPSYNYPAPNQANMFLASSAIPSGFLLTQSNDAALGGQFDAATNRLYCRFRRVAAVSTSQIYDVTKQSYYILMARGSSVGTTGFNYHFDRVASSSAVMLNSTSVVASSSQGYPMAKAHGCLMVLAWVMFASIGILMARYYKDMWPNHTLVGKQVWFVLHLVCQVSCWLCVIAAFVLIFCQVQGYSYGLQDPMTLHPILGIITFSLAFVNPIIAQFRCQPGARHRPFFNCIHFLVGALAYILAIPTMMLGLRLPRAGSVLVTLDSALGILIAFVGFQLMVEIILGIHGCLYHNQTADKKRKYEIELEIYRTTQGSQQTPAPPVKVKQPSGSTFKYFVAGVHAVVSVSCAVAIVVIIAVN